jgi:hypothetical protein
MPGAKNRLLPVNYSEGNNLRLLWLDPGCRPVCVGFSFLHNWPLCLPFVCLTLFSLFIFFILYYILFSFLFFFFFPFWMLYIVDGVDIVLASWNFVCQLSRRSVSEQVAVLLLYSIP